MAPPHRTAPDPLVLHTLRCTGFTGEERVASAALLDVDDVVATLEDLALRGLVTHHDGVFGGWGLTELGRDSDDQWLVSELDTTGVRSGVLESYEAFSGLNPKLLKVCHDWQMQGVSGAHFPNDHSDAAYDARVIDRLGGIHGEVLPVVESLSNLLARFGPYRTRLTAAVARVESGDHGYFTDGVESYHTVWFQLHEDLLSSLGIARWSENG